MTSTAKLGQRIKAFRLERNMTQKQIAAYLGVSTPTVLRLENGKGNVMELTRAKVERALNKAEVAA